jgi:uncharacterized cupredoxin-like copper-binding protein
MNTHTAIRIMVLSALLALALSACTSKTSPEAGAPPTKEAAATAPATAGGAAINVTLKEMTVALDKTQAPAGTTTFVVQNTGHILHNFAIKGNGVEQETPLLEPGQSATLTVDLSPGTYEYECAVPGHAMAGMQGTLTVT